MFFRYTLAINVGIKLQLPQLPSTKPVSDIVLSSVWKKISNEPFPDVYAFTFDDGDFVRMSNLLKTTPGIMDTRVETVGAGFDNKYVEACSFQFKGQMIILVKQSANLTDCLERELRLISSGDFSLKL